MNTKQGYLLIVEDDVDILELLKTTLALKDYRVVTTQNGMEALETAQREHPLAVIADIMMPQLDGFGLVHRLRINPETRHIPVVFITATYVTPEDREFASKIGVAKIIHKPVNIAAFLDTIDELLAGKFHTASNPPNEFIFYDEYRKHLETKLEQKNIQIARDEKLLGGLPETESRDIRTSLRQTILERDELIHLLNEINNQLERIEQ